MRKLPVAPISAYSPFDRATNQAAPIRNRNLELKKMFLTRLNGEGGKIFLETNGEEVAKNLKRVADGEELKLEYWHVKDGVNISLNPVALKSGLRVAAPSREVVVIQAGGEDVGSVEVEA